MQKYSEMSKEQLQALKKELDQQYAEIKATELTRERVYVLPDKLRD